MFHLRPMLVLLLGLCPVLAQNQLPEPTELSPAPRPLVVPSPEPTFSTMPVAMTPLEPEPTCLTSAEFLYWWSKTLPTPPLVTTSNKDDQGILGKPTTHVLAGGGKTELDPLVGFRLNGRYLHTERLGVDLSGVYLGNGGRYYTYTRQTLAIPYVDPVTDHPTSLVLANVDGPSGYAGIQAQSVLWGIEAGGFYRFSDDPEQPLELLVGGRYLMLTEDLRLWTYTVLNAEGSFLGMPQPSGTVFSGLDQFEARNHFVGLQLGVRHRYRSERCTIESSVSVAVGNTHQEMTINGDTKLNVPPQQTAMGNVFTQKSNIGRYTRDVITVLPQARVNVGFQVFDRMRVFVGGEVLYWSGVVRPADQIDPLIYPRVIPIVGDGTGGQPLPHYRSSHYWAVGLSLGTELAF